MNWSTYFLLRFVSLILTFKITLCYLYSHCSVDYTSTITRVTFLVLLEDFVEIVTSYIDAYYYTKGTVEFR